VTDSQAVKEIQKFAARVTHEIGTSPTELAALDKAILALENKERSIERISKMAKETVNIIITQDFDGHEPELCKAILTGMELAFKKAVKIVKGGDEPCRPTPE